ncbi:MAG: DUF3147 family protein [Proteobacteria bacterium]|nr:DUF3147 family protein [Pseudomonadota bacterium]
MKFLILKYLISAAIITFVSEIAKRLDRVGALIASLPLVTLLVLVWLYIEGQPTEKISNHAWYTFWYVLPTLPMFAAFPFLMKHFGFWLTLALSMLITLICFVIVALLARKIGVALI